MSRLVVVSNRIAPPDNKGGAGGLAVGVLGALKAAGGLWFGWSGFPYRTTSLRSGRDGGQHGTTDGHREAKRR